MSEIENENFVFYGSWRDAIDGLEKTMGRDFANEFARQIINYGTSGEVTTDDPMISGFINGMCKNLIEKSKNRYGASVKNGKQGGRPQKYDPAAIRAMSEEGMSHQEIAIQLGCSVKTVQRTLALDDLTDGIWED